MITAVADPASLGMDPIRLAVAADLVRAGATGPNPVAPALVGGVVRHGQVALVVTAGAATAETVFDLASLTKVVATTPLVMSLLEDGALRLDDPVALFFPEAADQPLGSVRLRHLLTHTSGLPAHRSLWQLRVGRADLAAFICRQPPEYVPGTRVVYSDLGYMLLGLLVERVTGLRLDQAIDGRVLGPAGMTTAGFCPAPDRHDCIAPTEPGPDGRPWQGVVHDENARHLGGVAGHAGLFAALADLCRYAAILLGGGPPLLSPASVDRFTRLETPGLEEPRSIGWQLARPGLSGGDLLSSRAFGHTGFTGTCLWIDPSLDLGIILLTNRVALGRDNTQIIRLRPRFANAVAAAVRDREVSV